MIYFLKVIRRIFAICAVVGFFLLIGAVGSADHADEVGEYYSFSEYTGQMVSGFLLMIPSIILERCLEMERELEGCEEDYDD